MVWAAAHGDMVCGIFSWHILEPAQYKLSIVLNATAMQGENMERSGTQATRMAAVLTGLSSKADLKIGGASQEVCETEVSASWGAALMQ